VENPAVKHRHVKNGGSLSGNPKKRRGILVSKRQGAFGTNIPIFEGLNPPKMKGDWARKGALLGTNFPKKAEGLGPKRGLFEDKNPKMQGDWIHKGALLRTRIPKMPGDWVPKRGTFEASNPPKCRGIVPEKGHH
jgi:hypothetical protein